MDFQPSFNLYPDVYVLPGQVWDVRYTAYCAATNWGTTANSIANGEAHNAFCKYTLYDGPDALIANKLLEMGISINPGNVDWYKRSLLSAQGMGAETTTQYMEDDFGVVPSGGVDQNFGGVAQPSTVESPAEEAVGAYINSVDVGGAIAEGLGGRNAFVASRYPGGASTQPPVSYGAETQTLTVPGRAYAAQTGSVYDEFGAYSKPGTSAEIGRASCRERV